MNYYRKHLKINSSPVKEIEKKDDNMISNNNDIINSKEERHNYQRRINTDINNENIVHNNPINLKKKDSYKFFRINKQEEEKEKNIIGNEIDNKEIQNNRMKLYEKKIINKPSFLELNNDIFSNSNQNGILYFNSTKNADHKKFEYPENINKIKITNRLYKKREINFNKDINNDNDNDNDNFNVFGGNDNLEENLNINEIKNNKISINNRNEIKKDLNVDENIVNKKKNNYNKKFVSIRNKIDENIQNGLVHYNSNKNFYLKDNSENNNNKKVKEVDTKNNKSPIRQNKIVDSEMLKTVDNQENRQKKFIQKYQLNSNLENNYIIRPKNYNSIFPRRNIRNKLIYVNNNQRTYNNNIIDEEKKSKKNYIVRMIDDQNKDNKIGNNDKEINNKELSIENKDNKIEKNDIKFKNNDNKIKNIDNNINYEDFKIKNDDYKNENRNKKIKIENRENNTNNNDIKIENNDIKIGKKDNKFKYKDNKIENKDKNIDNKDIKIENNNNRIGNTIHDRINYIIRSIFDFKLDGHNNIKDDDTQKINNNKDNKIIKDNENNNNNLINNNHDSHNRIKINNKISDDQDKLVISKLKNDNKKLYNDLPKNENNKNTIDNNNKNEIHNKKIVDEHHKIDISNIKNDNKKIKDKLINDNKKVCEHQNIIDNINKNENSNDNKNESNNINNNNKRKITNENDNNSNDDDLNDNLNVNEILKNINKENSKKEEQNPKKNLQNNKIKNEGERKRRRMRYARSYSNFIFLEDPCNCRLFKTINIFNSFLIMLNNIFNINDYLSDNKIAEEIKNINKNDRFNLITIFFNLNKLFWNSPNEMNISEVDLLKKYENFIDLFLKSYCKKAISSQFFIDINNMENILFNIFNQLNCEITQINNKNKSNYCYNNNNYNYNYNSNALSFYINNFFSVNNSVISRDFTGFYEKSIYCENCQNRYARFKMNYNKYIYYEHFFYINFDMNEINNFVKNNNQKIKLDFCFNYTLQKSRINYKYCSQCFVNGKKEITSIYSAPNILTIILSKNENSNFVLQEELDLKKYSYCNPGDGVYLLMSVLCRLIYNGKFISYCLNPKNGSWYSYTDGKIKRVSKMDINAIPLVLIYQIRGTIKLIYEGLQWDEDKIKITVKFNKAGLQPKELFFSKKALVKDVIEDIISIFNLQEYKDENEIKLLVNGDKADNDELLINVLEGNNNVLIFFRKK